MTTVNDTLSENLRHALQQAFAQCSVRLDQRQMDSVVFLMAPKVRKLLADMRSASVYPAFPKDFQPWMLSQREYQVLMHVIRGDDIETTARALGIQPLTVKSHRQRLYKKMGIKDHGVNTTWQVTRCALRSGLITVDDIL